MLVQFRKYTNNFLVKLLMALLVASFLIWGIGDVIRSASKDYVAVVDGDQYISVSDFIDAKKKQLQQLRSVYPNITPEQIKSLNLNGVIMSQLISNKLLEVEANNLGILVDDSIVLDLITKNPAFFDDKGKFSAENFKKVLAYNGIPESDYVAQIKRELATKMLVDSVQISVNPSDQLVSAVNIYNNQIAEIDLYTVDMAKLEVKAPDEQEIENYYKANLDKFSTNEYRDLEYLTISPQTYKSKVQISEQELQEELNNALSQNVDGKLYDYYDVIFDTKEKAQNALDKLQAGGDFVKIVTEITGDDPKNFLVKSQKTIEASPEVAKMLSQLKIGQNSALINSDLGYHIIKLVKISEQKRDQEKLKSEVKAHLIDQKIEEVMYNDVKTLEDELSSGKTMAEVAKQFGLTVNKIQMIDENGFGKDGKLNDAKPSYMNFLIEAFKQPENQPSDLLNIDESSPGYYVVSVAKIYPKQQLPLTQVKSKIIADLVMEKKKAKASDIIAQALVKLDSYEKQSDDITKTSLKINRPVDSASLDSNSIIPKDTQIAIFELKPDGHTSAFVTTKGDYAFAVQKSISRGADKMSPQEMKGLKEGIAYNLTSGLLPEYLRYLEQKYKVVVHSDIVAQIED